MSEPPVQCSCRRFVFVGADRDALKSIQGRFRVGNGQAGLLQAPRAASQRVRGGHQKGLSPPGDEIPSRPKSGRSGMRSTNSKRPRRPMKCFATRRSARSTINSDMRASRAGAAGVSARAKPSGTSSARCSAIFSQAANAAVRRCFAARTCAMNSSSISNRQCSAPRREIKIPSLAECKTCKGSGAAKGSVPKTCDTCHGQGQVRVQQSIFTIQQPCPRCKGTRQDYQQPVRYLLRAGPGQAGEDPAGGGAGRSRYRRSHSVERRGRGGPQWRTHRRSLCRDTRARTCDFRARGQPL